MLLQIDIFLGCYKYYKMNEIYVVFRDGKYGGVRHLPCGAYLSREVADEMVEQAHAHDTKNNLDYWNYYWRAVPVGSTDPFGQE